MSRTCSCIASMLVHASRLVPNTRKGRARARGKGVRTELTLSAIFVVVVTSYSLYLALG